MRLLSHELKLKKKTRKKGISPYLQVDGNNPIFQVHIQTIGILVAEKTELQSQLAQSQKIGEQRLSEYDRSVLSLACIFF